MDHTIRIYTSSNNALQRGFGAIRYNFGVNFATTFQDTKNRCLFVRTSASFAFDAFTTEVRFINFNLAFKGRLGFAMFCNSSLELGSNID